MIQHPFIRRSKIGKLLSLVCCISAGKTYTGLPVLMLLSLLLVVAGRLINLLLLLIPASSMEHNLLLAQPTVQRHRVGPAGSQHLAAQGERGSRSKCEPFVSFHFSITGGQCCGPGGDEIILRIQSRNYLFE